MASLLTIEGIGPDYAAKLRACGCGSTAKLLEMAGTAKGRRAMAKESGISEKRVLEWVNRADLMRIKGVGEEYADLIEATGVDSALELSKRKPANLMAAMTTTNDSKKLVRRLPTEAQVTGWVTQAKKLPKVVTH